MISIRLTAIALVVGLSVGTFPIFTADALSPRQLESQRKHENKVRSLYSSTSSSSSSSKKAILRTKTVKKQRSSSSRKAVEFKKDCTAKAWSCTSNMNICTNGIYQQTCTLIDGLCLHSEKVKPQPKICSSSSSSTYSGTIYDDIYLSGFAGKGQLNIDTLEEWIEAYKGSASHRSVISDLYDILFELKGLQKQVEALAEKAADAPLSDADNKKAGDVVKKMNDLINKSNKTIPN